MWFYEDKPKPPRIQAAEDAVTVWLVVVLIAAAVAVHYISGG